ncbi:hypothetical protein [Bordetella sp. FB-8]|uniref:hypothetical protein n=1 Tax=Bordetella sp. FB-8 TaxID=1159870 RepID=UPI000372872A|nr:hypothetical protein [Bordetella sp. FB-8]
MKPDYDETSDGDQALDETEPLKEPMSAAFIACALITSLFALAAILCAFKPHIGQYLRTAHWTVAHLALLLGALAVASGVATIAIRPLGYGRDLLAWPLAGLVWLLVAAAILLFGFRHPFEFFAHYGKDTAQGQTYGVPRSQLLAFSSEGGRKLWGTRTTYSLTWVGGPSAHCAFPGLAAPGQCTLMECVAEKTWWLAGASFTRSWQVTPLSKTDEIRNAQCRIVDPMTIKPGDYDAQGQRSVQH